MVALTCAADDLLQGSLVTASCLSLLSSSCESSSWLQHNSVGGALLEKTPHKERFSRGPIATMLQAVMQTKHLFGFSGSVQHLDRGTAEREFRHFRSDFLIFASRIGPKPRESNDILPESACLVI